MSLARLVDEVGLADEQNIAELDLLDQQVRDTAFVLVAEGFSRLDEIDGVLVVLKKVHAVHHGNQRVQAGDLGQGRSRLVGEGKGLGDRKRFGDAGGLDNEVVNASFPGELSDFQQQVFAQRATDAAITHFDETFLTAVQRDFSTDQCGINVHLAHVVDDHRNPEVLPVTQDVAH